MTGNNQFNFPANAQTAGHTIDLQGVASFGNLVETLAQELGTTAGKIQGLLPEGPANFQQLVGEIQFNTQGFQRVLTLYSVPGEPLKMRISSSWKDGLINERAAVASVESQFILSAPVEKIAPQARALARHLEEAFAVLDRMATLGQSSRLSGMSISEAELSKFEYEQAGGLVQAPGSKA